MDNIEKTLETAIDELGYASRTGYDEKKEFYIQNAIRFIEEAKEEIKLRKRYESFLKSVIRSGETLNDEKTFEWFCEKSK